MTDQDARLRRLFAQSDTSLPGDAFVATIQAQMAKRRRRLKVASLAMWVAGVVVFSLLLAPVAPDGDQVASLTGSLAQWPEQFASTLETRADALVRPVVPTYVCWVLASGMLPLAFAGWILGRGRRVL